MTAPYVLYVGRIDRNKGCADLFRYFSSFVAETAKPLELLLIGSAVMDIPGHPAIRHLGFLSEQDKFDALSGARVLLMPSPYESLSVVVLEAWAMGRPVLVNAACRVLEGQCMRSGGGLFYRGYSEFADALRRLATDATLRAALGAAGQVYVRAEYDWTVVERRTEGFLENLIRPAPGAPSACG